MLKLLPILRKHRQLADKRNPLFEQNRFAKYFFYFGIAFSAGYLLLIGSLLPTMLRAIFPNMEPYHMLNRVLIYFSAVDFLLRFSFHKPLIKEIKPYLLLPVGRKKLIGAYLLQNLTSMYNFFWFFLFVPFSLLTITRFYGLPGMLLYCAGIWLLSIANDYWYQLCRTLINEHNVFIALPLAFYALLFSSDFLFEGNPVSTFTMNLGEAFILGNPLAFAGLILAIGVLFILVHQTESHFIYQELTRQKDTHIKHLSSYRFLERFGETGEYIRLELKLIARNKSCRIAFRMSLLAIVLFSLLVNIDIDGERMYDSALGQSFVLGYCYAVLALPLTSIMSFEGNYLDGLMSRKESIYNLLLAKYYFYSLVSILPFVLLLPAVVRGRITLLASVAYLFLAIGPIYCMMFQLAVYNKRKAPLNESISGKNNGGNLFQTLVSFGAFMLPMLLNGLLTPILGPTAVQWLFIVAGAAMVISSRYWIHNVYHRFMKRRYENMEGFRN